MIRRVIKIDEDLCNGCGLCADACHEGAIQMVDGKAKLTRDDYCDGLGDCLPGCPTGAISFEQREALPYDQKAVDDNLKKQQAQSVHVSGGCPGSRSSLIERSSNPHSQVHQQSAPQSRLNQWPVQIKLVPVHAPYFNNAHVLIAADCAAYAHGNFHESFMKNKITLIGCPKLDEGDYSEKLTAILTQNDIKALTIVRMEVPCCGGIENAAKKALANCGKMIPWQVITLSTDGEVLEY